MIEFEFINKQCVNIYSVKGDERKLVGHVKTPAGSSDDVASAIQVCGFEEIYDLWGCGIFGEKTEEKYTFREIESAAPIYSKEVREEKATKRFIAEGRFKEENGKWHVKEHLTNVSMKKDIQLTFKHYERASSSEKQSHMSKATDFKNCMKCFNLPCNCDELVVKRRDDCNIELTDGTIINRDNERKWERMLDEK